MKSIKCRHLMLAFSNNYCCYHQHYFSYSESLFGHTPIKGHQVYLHHIYILITSQFALYFTIDMVSEVRCYIFLDKLCFGIFEYTWNQLYILTI